MTPAVHDRLLIWGFSAVSVGMLGSMVVWVNPFLEDIRSFIVFDALVPIALIGAVAMAVAKFSERG